MNTLPVYRQYGDGSGTAYPASRERRTNNPEIPAQDARSAFQELGNPAGGLPEPSTVMYDLKLAFHVVKRGAHAHDRMEERTPFHKTYVNQVQLAVDTLGLKGNQYHLPLRNKDGTVAGYAQFKRVSNRAHPVLATVLGPKMRPSGDNVESLLKFSAEALRSFVPEYGLDTKPEEAASRDERRHRDPHAPPQLYTIHQAVGSLDAKPIDPVIENGAIPSEVPSSP